MMNYFYRFWQFYFRLPILIRLLSTIVLLMFLFGLTIHWVEPKQFPTIFEGIWWAIVTGSTVGYGDYVPLSSTGKAVAILLILAGGGMLTLYIGTISAGTVKHEQDLSKGKVRYKGRNHIIFVGWNERTRQLLDMIIHNNLSQQIVLIDHTLSVLPYRQHHIHFIRGYASDDDVLHKANVSEATYAIITSDPSQKERNADQTSILTTMAMKGNNPELYIITEVLTREQVTNAKRAGADTVIRSNDFMSTLFYHEIFRNDPIKPFDLLLEFLSNQQFKQLDIPTKMIGKTFLECSDYYMELDKILIGIIREGKVKLNPPFNSALITGDRLIVVSRLT